MPISSRTRSRRGELDFSIDSDSSVEDTPVIFPTTSPTTALYTYTNLTMDSAPAVDTSSEEFQRAVQAQVQKAIQDMIIDGRLASPGSASGGSSGGLSGGTLGGGQGGSNLPASPTLSLHGCSCVVRNAVCIAGMCRPHR